MVIHGLPELLLAPGFDSGKGTGIAMWQDESTGSADDHLQPCSRTRQHGDLIHSETHEYGWTCTVVISKELHVKQGSVASREAGQQLFPSTLVLGTHEQMIRPGQ